MSDWDMNVQRMIDYAERNLRGELTPGELSRRLGYSPWYCTRQFSRVVGMNLRSYLRLRRLSEAAAALRDGKGGILEVAVEFGFSSQEAFSRAFKGAWGMSPGDWRAHPRPIRLLTRRQALLPSEGGIMRTKDGAGRIDIGMQKVPARRFIGIKAPGATDYMDFWAKIGAKGLDCASVEGVLASITANAQIGGWYGKDWKEGYLYGVEVAAYWSGEVPEGMELMDIPAAEYLVFHHPPYDFVSGDEAVWLALKAAAEARKEAPSGYRWDHSLPAWQRHDPESLGQAWCLPLKRA